MQCLGGGYQTEENEMGGACRTYGGEERYIQGFGGETSGKETIWGPTLLWEDDIKMDLKDISFGGVDRDELAQDRDKFPDVVKTVMNCRIP